MFSMIRTMMDRFKCLFMTQAVLELQSAVIVACADRKAELLRRAARFDEEGLADIAAYLRRQVESLSTEKSLVSVLAIAEHWQAAPPALPPILSGPSAPSSHALVTTNGILRQR
jgi:hypothetical protein